MCYSHSKKNTSRKKWQKMFCLDRSPWFRYQSVDLGQLYNIYRNEVFLFSRSHATWHCYWNYVPNNFHAFSSRSLETGSFSSLPVSRQREHSSKAAPIAPPWTMDWSQRWPVCFSGKFSIAHLNCSKCTDWARPMQRNEMSRVPICVQKRVISDKCMEL